MNLGGKLTARAYRPAQDTEGMESDTRRGYKAMVMGLLYVLLWIWFCGLSNAKILHSLVAGVLIALPAALVWRAYARRGKKQRQAPPTLPRNETQILTNRNRLRREDVRRNAQISDERVDSLADQILQRNRDLLDKFVEIAERKVSALDAYGDEKWNALPGEILLCMKKLAQRERRAIDWTEYSKAKRRIKRDPGLALKIGSHGQLDSVLPKEFQLIETRLMLLFHEYHERRKARSVKEVDIDALSGVEFQTHIAAILRSCGYDVIGTPIAGDQGGDLIAKKEGKTYVIQTKRSERPVGNKAVQEAISALCYYGADQGWVITNSTFTPSAVALAQKANIKLIDGLTLRTESLLCGSLKEHRSEPTQQDSSHRAPFEKES